MIFYHGTRYPLEGGQLLTGAGAPRGNCGYGDTDGHVYFTTDVEIATDFAHGAYGPVGNTDAPPHVYQVTPMGEYVSDMDEPDFPSFKSCHPVKVVRIVR